MVREEIAVTGTSLAPHDRAEMPEHEARHLITFGVKDTLVGQAHASLPGPHEKVRHVVLVDFMEISAKISRGLVRHMSLTTALLPGEAGRV